MKIAKKHLLLVDADITHALDEELSYQTPGDREEELIPLREYLHENHFEVDNRIVTMKRTMNVCLLGEQWFSFKTRKDLMK
jgi:hypothetical protein